MRCYKAILLLILLGASARAVEPAAPDPDPLWEVGLFGGVATLPHYRGSDEYSLYALPLPFVIYRGKIVQADRDGLRGVFYRSEHLESTLSFSGAPPVDSDNKARRGMPGLDAVVGGGPALKWFFAGRNPVRYAYVNTAARAVFAAHIEDVELEYQGLNGGVAFVYRDLAVRGDDRLRFGFNFGLDFSDAGYHRYFYDVAEAYATTDRPAYDSRGGYGGFVLSMNLVRRVNDRFSIGGYYRWENITGTVFADSPLVKENDNHIIGAALIWRAVQSKQRAGEEFYE